MKRTVLITGAGGGLGQALVNEFSVRNWRVIATDVGDKFTVERYPSQEIWKLPMDVTSGESIHSAFEKVKGEMLELDLIINNAGIDSYFPLCETPVDRFLEIFQVNVFGSYRVNQAFLSLMRRPGGRIIHLSSESVKINMPFMPYPISKQALEGYCRSIRHELGFLGIDVTMIRPGAIRTALLDHLKKLKNPVENSLLSGPFEKFALQAWKEVGKTIEPEIVARFIYRVASLKKTRACYRINNDPKLTFAAFLPTVFLESFVFKRLR